MNNFDNRSIEIPCPKCSHKVKKTIGWLKRNNKMICASCGVASVLEANFSLTSGALKASSINSESLFLKDSISANNLSTAVVSAVKFNCVSIK